MDKKYSISTIVVMLEEQSPQDREWLARGVDVWMIRDPLQLSYETRIAQHQDTLDTIERLQQMKRRNQLQLEVKK